MIFLTGYVPRRVNLLSKRLSPFAFPHYGELAAARSCDQNQKENNKQDLASTFYYGDRDVALEVVDD